jgi:hypothetical protein
VVAAADTAAADTVAAADTADMAAADTAAVLGMVVGLIKNHLGRYWHP